VGLLGCVLTLPFKPGFVGNARPIADTMEARAFASIPQFVKRAAADALCLTELVYGVDGGLIVHR
jgi:hypothetical protein